MGRLRSAYCPHGQISESHLIIQGTDPVTHTISHLVHVIYLCPNKNYFNIREMKWMQIVLSLQKKVGRRRRSLNWKFDLVRGKRNGINFAQGSQRKHDERQDTNKGQQVHCVGCIAWVKWVVGYFVSWDGDQDSGSLWCVLSQIRHRQCI